MGGSKDDYGWLKVIEKAEKQNSGDGDSSSPTGEMVWQSTHLVDVLEEKIKSLQTHLDAIRERMSMHDETIRELINVNERLRGMALDHPENGKEPHDGMVSASQASPLVVGSLSSLYSNKLTERVKGSGVGYHLVLVNANDMDNLPTGSEKHFTDEILKAVSSSRSYKSASQVFVKVYIDRPTPGDHSSSRYLGFKSKVEKVFGFNDDKANFKVNFTFGPGEPEKSVMKQVSDGLGDSSCSQIIVLGLKLSDLKTAITKTPQNALRERPTPEQLITIALERPYYHWAKDVAAAGFGTLFLDSDYYRKNTGWDY